MKSSLLVGEREAEKWRAEIPNLSDERSRDFPIKSNSIPIPNPSFFVIHHPNHSTWPSLFPKIPPFLKFNPFFLLDSVLRSGAAVRRAEESDIMFPLPMEPRPASSGFPFAIRARLSTEDSSSDASSFIAGDSDDNSGVDESEEEAEEDNGGSLRRPFMPIARVTGDDEDDDVVDELLFDEEEEANPKLVVEKMEVESSNEDFGGGFESGREESGLFYGNEVKGDSLGGYEGTVIVSEEELRVQEKEKGYVEVVERVAASSDDAGTVEGGLELNDVKQNKGFELEVKDLMADSSIIESEKCNLVGNIDSAQNSVMEVELRTLGAESVIPEVEDDTVEIVTIKAARDVASSQHRNEVAEAKLSKFEDTEEEVGGDIDSKNLFFGEKMLEVSEVEAHPTESERFEAPNAVCFSHSPILEMLSLHDNKAFEPKDEVLHMKINSVDSVKAKDSAFELLVSTDGNHSPYGKEMDSIDSYHFTYDEDLAEEDEHEISEWPHSESVKRVLKEIDEGSSTSHSSFESSQTYSNILGIQSISNSDEETEIDEDDNAKELFDTSTLAALLWPSHGASSFGVPHPTSQNTSYVNDLKLEEQMLYSKIERIRAKYLRYVEKVGVGFIDSMSRGKKIGAKNVTFLYDEGEDEFAFSCTILVLGKTGMGKSALINSIFGEERALTDPLQPATISVREISGVVDGVYIRFIDTPGLSTSLNDQPANLKVLSSVKKYIRRFPPDAILYVDRLDEYNRDFNELSILRMITRTLGSSIWFNAIIALTHAASAVPEGPDGSSVSYDEFIAQRSKIVQCSIRRAAEDMSLMNLVALVENYHCPSRNEDGESLLPNGCRWKPWLLLLCYSSKILSELNTLFPIHRAYPLPFLFSSFLQSKVQGCESDYFDFVMDFDNMAEEALKPLRKSEVQNIAQVFKNAIFDENDYKIKLFQKKNWKEELRRLKKMKGGKVGFENPANINWFLDPRFHLLIRTVLQTHSWDYDSSIKSNHGELCSTLSSLNIPVGRKKKKKAATGTLITSMEENLVNGFKLVDRISIGKKPCLFARAGVVRARMNVARGTNLEVWFNEKDRDSKTAGYNGQISLKISTTEHVHLALLGLFSLVLSVWSKWNG